MNVIKQKPFSVAVANEKGEIELVHMVAYCTNVSESFNMDVLHSLPLFVPYEADAPEWAEKLSAQSLMDIVYLPKREEQSARPCVVCSIEKHLSDNKVLDCATYKPTITLSLNHRHHTIVATGQLFDTLLSVNPEYDTVSMDVIVLSPMGRLRVHNIRTNVMDAQVCPKLVLFYPSKYLSDELPQTPERIQVIPYKGIRPMTETGFIVGMMRDAAAIHKDSAVLSGDCLYV